MVRLSEFGWQALAVLKEVGSVVPGYEPPYNELVGEKLARKTRANGAFRYTLIPEAVAAMEREQAVLRARIARHNAALKDGGK